MVVFSEGRFLLCLIAVLLFSSPGFAECSCDVDANNGSIASGGVVFSARVEDMIFINAYDYLAKAKVIDMWSAPDNKVSESRYLYVASSLSDEECGIELILGYRYLIAARYEGPMLVVDRCGITKRLEEVSVEEMKKLGSPVYSYTGSLAEEN